MNKKRLISGIKPTGKSHLGNYFGAMKQFVDLQDEYESFVMIADYHALNFVQNREEMRALTHNLVLDYLGIGLDPEKVVLFKQSAVPAHTELAWIFDTITTMPYLMRAHAFKDAEAKNKEISVGAFNYPTLMAADILLYSPDIVPVGKDQKQHVEYARDTAEKFNRIFGDTFKLPVERIIDDVATVPGIDGQKMSKSYNNHIELFATDEEIRSRVMSIVTDSKGTSDPKDPGTDNVFALHRLFGDTTELAERYKTGGIGYKESKELLTETIIKFVSPMRERRAEWEAKPDAVKQIIEEGNAKANAIASHMLADVKRAIGVL